MEIDAVFIAKCNETSLSQKWIWGFANETALYSWTDFGTEIVDKREIALLEENRK